MTGHHGRNGADDRSSKRIGTLLLAWLAGGILVIPPGARAGDLAPPPGPVAPTMKTLTQVEPRTPLPPPVLGEGLAGPGVVIAAPGSYYLVADVVGVAGAPGIVIMASNVTLDLNGFTVLGVPGATSGIVVPAAVRNIALFNGTVRNWPVHGVDAFLAENSLARDLRVSDNGGDGIRIGASGIVTHCQIQNVANGDGIETGGSGLVSHCTITLAATGIRAGSSSNVFACTVTGVTQGGIVATNDTTIRECNLSFVLDATGTSGGIEVGTGCLVIGNSISIGPAMGPDGIRVTGAHNRIEANRVRYGGSGSQNGIVVTAAGNLVIRNSVSLVGAVGGLAYDIVPGNTAGPVVVAAGIATSDNPHANYAY